MDDFKYWLILRKFLGGKNLENYDQKGMEIQSSFIDNECLLKKKCY